MECMTDKVNVGDIVHDWIDDMRPIDGNNNTMRKRNELSKKPLIIYGYKTG